MSFVEVRAGNKHKGLDMEEMKGGESLKLACLVSWLTSSSGGIGWSFPENTFWSVGWDDRMNKEEKV